MSEISQPAPFLSISSIEKIKVEIIMHSGGSGWMLGNRLDEGSDYHQSSLALFIMAKKAEFQLEECLLYNLKKIQEYLTNFSAGNFDKYIDEHNRDSDEDDAPFDPYAELAYRLTTDGYNDLPDKIERFKELLTFAKTSHIRKEVNDRAFEEFFKGIERHYMGEDADGNRIMIPGSQIPSEQMAEIKHKKEVKELTESVELEFCLDNYNDWLATITKMVQERRPFSEMLILFKL